MVHCQYGDILQAIFSKAENKIALEYSLWFFCTVCKVCLCSWICSYLNKQSDSLFLDANINEWELGIGSETHLSLWWSSKTSLLWNDGKDGLSWFSYSVCGILTSFRAHWGSQHLNSRKGDPGESFLGEAGVSCWQGNFCSLLKLQNCRMYLLSIMLLLYGILSQIFWQMCAHHYRYLEVFIYSTVTKLEK